MNIDPYYTLDKIPIHRQELIELKVKQFIRKNNIKKWPLDLVQIILNIVENGKMPISIKSMELSNKVDALTIHVAGINIYQIFVNRNRINYPFKASKDRRLNFTLVHEIGHIYLNHLIDFEATKLYRGSLTKEEYKVLENESNAFARNVLTPAVIVKDMHNIMPQKISLLFGITKKAAETRIDLLYDDLKSIHICGIETKALKLNRNM